MKDSDKIKLASKRCEKSSEILENGTSSTYGSFQIHHDATKERGYSVTRVRVVSTIVTMLLGCTQSLGVVSQYLIHRLNEESGSYNSSVDMNNSMCRNKVLNDSRFAHTDALQAKVSTLVKYFIFTSSFPAVVSSLTIGAFADHLGRRFTLLLPLLGLTIKLIIITCIIKFRLDIWVFFIAYIVEGLVGGGPVIRIALFSMVADTNQEKQPRMLWMTIINGLCSVMTSTSSILTGALIHDFGFFSASLFLATTMALTFFIPFVFLSETLPRSEAKVKPREVMSLEANSNSSKSNQSEAGESETKDCQLIFECLCTSWKRVFGVFLCDGSLRQRLMLTTCLGMFSFTAINEFSVKSIDTLYQLHNPFCWDARLIGYYSALQTGGQCLVGMMLLRLLQCCVKEDFVGMMSALFQAGSYVMEAFVKNTWQLFLVPVVGIPGGLVVPVVRGIMSMLVDPSSQGAMFTSLAVVDMLCHIIGSTTYNGIYAATVRTFPGEVYLVMASSSFVTFLLFLVYFCVHAKAIPTRGDLSYDVVKTVHDRSTEDEQSLPP